MLQWLRVQLVFWPTLLWNVLLGRVLRVRRWWDRIDEHIVLGALPFPSDVPKLAQLGVTGVINTCREYPGPLQAYQKHGITQLHIPIVDFVHPTLKEVETGLEFIRQRAAGGESVYVHCKAGRARSATIVICWLIEQGMSPEEAQRHLLQTRPHVNPKLASREAVKQWVEKRGAAGEAPLAK